MDRDWHTHRDELIISTKAGYDMWPGPYGDHGSRKYLIASLDQSLKRMHLDYVDIFYHHRPDPDTPIEETMGALDHIVRSGKAIALLFAFCGICALFDISPLLGCMSMSTVYINITDDDKLFKQLNYWSPPLLLLFFPAAAPHRAYDRGLGARQHDRDHIRESFPLPGRA